MIFEIFFENLFLKNFLEKFFENYFFWKEKKIVETLFTGDSGGPLVCDINGTLTLMGIVSKGRMCNKVGLPGIYTNIQAFRSWLDESKSKITSIWAWINIIFSRKSLYLVRVGYLQRKHMLAKTKETMRWCWQMSRIGRSRHWFHSCRLYRRRLGEVWKKMHGRCRLFRRCYWSNCWYRSYGR